MERFWTALFAGQILPMDAVESFVEPRTDVAPGKRRYGRGFWIRPDRPTVMLEGMDAGVSFRSAYDRPSGLIYTVISNTSSGAWPMVKHLDQQCGLRCPNLAHFSRAGAAGSSASGSLATFSSCTILPVSSTIQTLVSSTETSSPAKWSICASPSDA